MSKKNNFILNKESYETACKTINKFAQAVLKTMGPMGGYALIGDATQAKFTKDGITVIKNINSTNCYEQIYLLLLKEAAEQTHLQVGDGTTTAVSLLVSIYNEGYKKVVAGYNLRQLAEGMNAALHDVETEIKKNTITPEKHHLTSVATIAVNNDKVIGQIIEKAISLVDPQYGLIAVEETKVQQTHLEIIEGISTEEGYVSPYFAYSDHNNKNMVEYDDGVLLLVHGSLNSNFALKVLDYAAITKKKLLILCDDVDKATLSTTILNNYQKLINVTIGRFSKNKKHALNILQDIAVLTGSVIIDFDNCMPEHTYQFDETILGSFRRATISPTKTCIFTQPANKQLLSQRQAEIKHTIDTCIDEQDKAIHQARFSQLNGKSAIIKIGGSSPSIVSDIKDKIEDGLCATKAAVHGVIIGGGFALYRTKQKLLPQFINKHSKSNMHEAYKQGYLCVINALDQPAKQILRNGDLNPDVILEQLKSEAYEVGFDTLKGSICNLMKHKILDTAQSTLMGIKTAVQICQKLFNTHCAINNPPASNAAANQYSGMI